MKEDTVSEPWESPGVFEGEVNGGRGRLPDIPRLRESLVRRAKAAGWLTLASISGGLFCSSDYVISAASLTFPCTMGLKGCRQKVPAIAHPQPHPEFLQRNLQIWPVD